jgi:hypothetical protein
MFKDSCLPEPYRHDLAFRLLNAVSRSPNERTKANMPFANLHEGKNSVKFGFSLFGMRNSSTSPWKIKRIIRKETENKLKLHITLQWKALRIWSTVWKFPCEQNKEYKSKNQVTNILLL